MKAPMGHESGMQRILQRRSQLLDNLDRGFAGRRRGEVPNIGDRNKQAEAGTQTLLTGDAEDKVLLSHGADLISWQDLEITYLCINLVSISKLLVLWSRYHCLGFVTGYFKYCQVSSL